MEIVITAPNLNPNINVSGISAITNSIISLNREFKYVHFEIGSYDGEASILQRFLKTCKTYLAWAKVNLITKFDLIHFNFPLEKFSILRDVPLIIYSRILRKKILIHLHGGRYLVKDSIPFIHNLFLKIVFSYNLPIIVLSTIEEKTLRNKYKCKSIFVLPNAVVTDDNIVDRKKNEFKNLLFMSRIHKSKGLETIADAFKILVKGGSDFTFTLCGDGPDKDWFVNSIKEILGQRLIYKGVISGEEKNSIISRADIFLLPSIYGEGLPVALLETMSKGVIPIVTDDGSILSVVKNGENGIVVEKNNPSELAKAINTLLGQRQLCLTLSEKAEETIRSNFDIREYVKKLNLIYQMII